MRFTQFALPGALGWKWTRVAQVNPDPQYGLLSEPGGISMIVIDDGASSCKSQFRMAVDSNMTTADVSRRIGPMRGCIDMEGVDKKLSTNPPADGWAGRVAIERVEGANRYRLDCYQVPVVTTSKHTILVGKRSKNDSSQAPLPVEEIYGSYEFDSVLTPSTSNPFKYKRGLLSAKGWREKYKKDPFVADITVGESVELDVNNYENRRIARKFCNVVGHRFLTVNQLVNAASVAGLAAPGGGIILNSDYCHSVFPRLANPYANWIELDRAFSGDDQSIGCVEQSAAASNTAKMVLTATSGSFGDAKLECYNPDLFGEYLFDSRKTPPKNNPLAGFVSSNIFFRRSSSIESLAGEYSPLENKGGKLLIRLNQFCNALAAKMQHVNNCERRK